jgi:prepilin-type N-terminal cleavage/methylation domain-containing protein
MKNLSQNRKFGARGGFTILELVVTVTVFGILTAAAAVSWVSFSRYQQLRESAGAFHKELLALKAKALETGNTFTIKYTTGGVGYTVTETGTDENGDTINTPKIVKTVPKIGNNVKMERYSHSGSSISNTGLPKVTTNNWTSITIAPRNLEAFQSGSMIISNGSNKYFCIQRDDNSVKPELYYKSGGGQWKKM